VIYAVGFFCLLAGLIVGVKIHMWLVDPLLEDRERLLRREARAFFCGEKP
jgi:hypothetical protein